MEIVKVFSEVDTEEKLYSVLMDEDEILLFSELQKEFARRDYAGLSKEAANYVRKERHKLAKNLNDSRKLIQGPQELKNDAYKYMLDYAKEAKKGHRFNATSPYGHLKNKAWWDNLGRA